MQATKPSDDYIIDLKDVGPRRNTEELFSRVGVSIHNHTQAHMAMEYISAATIAIHPSGTIENLYVINGIENCCENIVNKL